MDHPTTPAWSTSDVSLQYKVFLGLWTNWSHGSVLGQTLTMERQEGNLLIAFTSVFITFVGSRFWNIACLALHRHYSTPEARDAIHHQRQVVLRNSSSPDAGLYNLVRLHLAWGETSRLLRLLPSLLTAAFCVCAFTIAGGFSSQISSSTGGEVLLDGANCAYLSGTAETTPPMESYVGNNIANAVNYVQQCYSANSTGLVDCKSFAVQNVPGYMNTTAPCPFGNGLCRNSSSNLILDTGYLDSHADFGLNAPPDERFKLRRVLHCAPLVTDGHTSEYVDQYGNKTLYNYGGLFTGVNSTTKNYTYAVQNIDSQYTGEKNVPIYGNYILDYFFSGTRNGSTYIQDAAFLPEDDLYRSDADVMLAFLSGNGVISTEPTDDEWYRANVPYGTFHAMGLDTNYSTYRPGEAASPLGCAEQFQICGASTSECGPLASLHDATDGVLEKFGIEVEGDTWAYNDTSERRRLAWFLNFVYASASASECGIGPVISHLRAQSLDSAKTLQDSVQVGRLPGNQWQLDVTHWWATALALQQSVFIYIALGSYPAGLSAYRVPPSDDTEKRMCASQKIQTDEYASFNFFGLILTYVVGTVITATSFALEPILSHLQRRRRYKQYAQLEWTTNGTLQIHRLANERTEENEWSGCTHTVPTTKPGVLLAPLDLTKAEHPKLCHKMSSSTMVQSTPAVLEGSRESVAETVAVGEPVGSGSAEEEDVSTGEQGAADQSGSPQASNVSITEGDVAPDEDMHTPDTQSSTRQYIDGLHDGRGEAVGGGRRDRGDTGLNGIPHWSD